jgi:uncharacterized protein with GYD domain
METSIVLFNLTEQGAKDIKGFRDRYDLMARAIEGAGGNIKGYYACMGPYDYVMIVEGLSAEEGMRLLLMNAMMGATRTMTMRAFPLEEFTDIVKKL